MNEQTEQPQFVLCVENTGYPASLEVRKVYQTLRITPAEAGFLRVIDESGEDYLYPASYFVALELPRAAEQALLRAA